MKKINGNFTFFLLSCRTKQGGTKASKTSLKCATYQFILPTTTLVLDIDVLML